MRICIGFVAGFVVGVAAGGVLMLRNARAIAAEQAEAEHEDDLAEFVRRRGAGG